eukprot:gb/GFBE01054914.1/.p1 GENE.gb/GFBE01054914.1/~~gb/GFBE01054914.1/.p1  ORF type:complete len:464 (+),score=83.57 gb/GFBE01054914.1/:1-1392(+)
MGRAQLTWAQVAAGVKKNPDPPFELPMPAPAKSQVPEELQNRLGEAAQDRQSSVQTPADKARVDAEADSAPAEQQQAPSTPAAPNNSASDDVEVVAREVAGAALKTTAPAAAPEVAGTPEAEAETQEPDECPVCDGTGLLLKDPCPLCQDRAEMPSAEDASRAPAQVAESCGKAEEGAQPREEAVSSIGQALPMRPPPGLEQIDGESPVPVRGIHPWRLKQQMAKEKERIGSFSSETTIGAQSRKCSATDDVNARVVDVDAVSNFSSASSNAYELPEVDWPADPVQPGEVHIIGEIVQQLFADGFSHMTVCYAAPAFAQGFPMPQIQVKLHLSDSVRQNLLAPLARLQGELCAALPLRGCQAFRMHRSKDNKALYLSCALMTDETCWDIIRNGYCQRSMQHRCRWHHPVPVLIAIAVVGDTSPELICPQMISSQLLTPLAPTVFHERCAAAPLVRPNLMSYED